MTTKIAIIIVVVLGTLVGCTTGDEWFASVDSAGRPRVVFCESFDAYRLSVMVRVPETPGSDKLVDVWEATGAFEYSALTPLTVGIAPPGTTSSSVFDPAQFQDSEMHVLITGTEPDSSSSVGLEAIFEVSDLALGSWLSNDDRMVDEPCK